MGVLHRPHTGLRPLSTFSSGTRLVTPQEGQRINRVSDMAASPCALRSARPADQIDQIITCESLEHSRGPSSPRRVQLRRLLHTLLEQRTPVESHRLFQSGGFAGGDRRIEDQKVGADARKI